MSQSIHSKLERVRPPRVHIKYEVFTNGAMVMKELPFVVGVMGDFSGNPTSKLKDLKDRKFIQIDRDNFNEVMGKMTPGLNFRVDNMLPQKEGEAQKEIAVQLKFNSMDDFEPAAVVSQVPALQKLLETRNKLRDLLVQVDKSDKLENQLEAILQNTEQMKQLQDEMKKPEGGAAQ